MKRIFLRSMSASQSKVGWPLTFDFMPTSANSSQYVMPGLHSYSAPFTSSRVVPSGDTMPMPVTTTRGSAMDTELVRLIRCSTTAARFCATIREI